jgi:putative endopeptidase
MSAATKDQALEKLAAFHAQIGYPDRWRDYGALTIGRRSYLDNVIAANAFDVRRQLARIGKPVDRGEWEMTPQTVNAYYNPLLNEIVFPAAILQPPYFDPDADDATNYGAMGAIIGHEIIHGFDDQGSKFDAAGNLRSWWSSADREAFEGRTARLAAQYDAYVAIDALHVNGRLTLGENLADFGGLQIAYDAFKLATTRFESTPPEARDADQRFFRSWARSWRRNYSPQALKLMLNTDSHAPSGFRVNGPLANIEAFASAFDCKAGDAMVNDAARRIAIW